MKKPFSRILQIAKSYVPVVVIGWFYAGVAHAELLDSTVKTKISTGLSLKDTSPVDVVALLLDALLGLLAVIALIIIVRAGIIWMTAGGDMDKIDKAKTELRWAAIGLLVILASHSITSKIFELVEEATQYGK